MTYRRLATALPRLLVVVVLVWSGWYLLLYLLRWEWNRALISGLFFVSAEIALSTTMLLRRLRSLEQRVDDVTSSAGEPAVDPVDRPNPFAWLRPGQGTFVFVPVLLGVGVILSALAYVVERVAEVTAPGARGRGAGSAFASLETTDRRLVPSTERIPSGPVRESHGRAVGRAVAVLGSAALLVTLAVLLLMDVAQTRPDPSELPAATVIVLDLDQKRPEGSATMAAEALWFACRPRLGGPPRPAMEMTAIGGDRVRLELRPGLGETTTRRFTGCLRDATLDLVRAEVLDVSTYD